MGKYRRPKQNNANQHSMTPPPMGREDDLVETAKRMREKCRLYLPNDHCPTTTESVMPAMQVNNELSNLRLTSHIQSEHNVNDHSSQDHSLDESNDNHLNKTFTAGSIPIHFIQYIDSKIQSQHVLYGIITAVIIGIFGMIINQIYHNITKVDNNINNYDNKIYNYLNKVSDIKEDVRILEEKDRYIIEKINDLSK